MVGVSPVTSMTSSTVIRTPRSLFSTHGLPDTIVSDNASVFTSVEYLEFLMKNGIRAITVAPYHPSSNGQAERYVQTAKQALRRIMEGDWPTRLSRFLLSQHSTPSASTGVSPAERLMGRRLNIALDRLHPDSITDKRKSNSDTPSNLIEPRVFTVGDLVYARNYTDGHKWVPAIVTKVSGPLSYVVETQTKQLWRRHVDQLRRRLSAPDTTSPCTDNGIPGDNTDPDPEITVPTPVPVSPVPARGSPTRQEPGPNLSVSPGSPLRRSTRLRSAPRRLQDFYVNV